MYIKNQSISQKNYSLRNLCLKTANDKCQIRVATAIHVSVNKTSLLFICALITWLKSCWCSIKTFIQDTYFFLLWNLGLFWQEFWAIYGKPIWIMLYKYSKIELKPSLELLRVWEASLLMSSTWMMKLYDAVCINNRNISGKLYKNNFFTSK